MILSLLLEERTLLWGPVKLVQGKLVTGCFSNKRKTICEVMKQKSQYQFLDYGMPTQQQVAYLMPLAKAILEKKIDDPTKGAKWFHTKQMQKPIWAKTKQIKVAYNNHIFY
jgi:spore germination cell wall hydrolase CwlJ-like protein